MAIKPTGTPGAATRHVLYKGPFRQVEDDRGQTFPRGCWVPVDEATWQCLATSALAEQFAMPRE